MTVDSLKDCNKKVLARMAKDQGIVGWHAMRKDQLIRALSPPSAALKKDATKASPEKTTANPPAKRPAPSPSPARILPVAPRPLDHACVKDRIIAMVRDPYWLHAYWELSRSTLARAQAALGQDWHTARPVLRLMDVTSEDTTSASERHVRDIEIHGGVNNWYIDVINPPRSYRIDIGYLARRGKFFVLARSNVVSTPKAGVSDVLDENWASVQEQFQKIYHQSGGASGSASSQDLRELFEERLRRPMHGLSLQSLGTGALHGLSSGFHFEIDAELIVYGHRAQRQGHPPGRAGPAPPRRDLHRPVQPARLPPDHPRRRRQPRRRRGADHRPGRRAEHQGTRADDPRRQRTLSRRIDRLTRPDAAPVLPFLESTGRGSRGVGGHCRIVGPA